MSLELVLAFIEQKKVILSKDSDSLDILQSQSPSKIVEGEISTTASDSIWDDIKDSPLSQLGKDFVSEQIAKNGAKILNNIETVVGNTIRKPVQDAQNLIFDSISAALTAKNDLILFFLQQLAKNAIVNIQKKRDILLILQEKLRLLYNALVLLVNGNPFFSKYLSQLRQALLYIFEARNETTLVRNNLVVSDTWLRFRFEDAKTNLKKAEALMQPLGPPPDVAYTKPGLLQGVGVTSEPQQLQLLLSIPQLVQEVLAAANGYFVATFKVNALLLAFISGYSTLEKVGSKKLKEYSVSTLDNLVKQMDDLITAMATALNGDPTAVAIPLTGYIPDSVKVSASSIGWLLQLKTIIEYANFVPGPVFTTLQVSNFALSKYQAAVELIKSKDTRTLGDAILTATDGREEVGQLESQLTTFCLASLKAIVSAKTSEGILSLGRTLQQRLDLSIVQDKEIEEALASFANADLGFPSALQRMGAGIFTMLDNFGFDRAAGLLRDGEFGEFFNLNTKTATYAGAALAGLSVLKECLKTEEDREQIVQAEREIQRESKAKELLAQRNATTGFQQQKSQNYADSQSLEIVGKRAEEANNKCGLPDDFKPGNLLKNIGSVLGVGIFGGNTLSDSLAKLGRGII